MMALPIPAYMDSPMRRFRSPLHVSGLAALALLNCAPALAAGDPTANPYGADVRRALTPPPGAATPGPAQPTATESPACRQLRMKLERLREAPPAADVPGAGYAGSRRPLAGQQPGAPTPDQRTLEVRYQTECR
jgi:hypothetical protein